MARQEASIEADGEQRRTRTANASLPWLAPFLISFVGIGIAHALYINHDAALFLVLAQRMVAGMEFCTTLTPPNTAAEACMLPKLPMTAWLHVPPAWLSAHTPVSLPNAFLLYCYCLLQLGGVMSGLLIQRLSGLSTPARLGVALALVYLGLFLLPVLSFNDFGQRDHLLMGLTLPYYLLCVVRLESPTPSVSKYFVLGVGLIAGIGFMIKPPYLLLFAICELFLIVRYRDIRFWWRTEALIILGVSFGYALILITAYPEVFELLPYVVESAPFYDLSIARKRIMLRPAVMLAVASLLVFVFSARTRGPNTSDIPRYADWLLICLFLGTLCTYSLQSGFYYHLYPVNVIVLCASSFVLWGFWAYMPSSGLPLQVLRLAVLLATLWWLAPPSISDRVARRERFARELEVFQPYLDGKRTMVVGPGFGQSYITMLESEAKWVGSMWFMRYLGASYSDRRLRIACFHPPEKMGKLERLYHEWLMYDMTHVRPDAILLYSSTRHRSLRGRRCDVESYLMMDPRFADRWKDYSEVAGSREWSLFLRQ